MKILHTADNHFQSKRLDECVKTFLYMVEYAKKQEVDLIIQAGDLFERNTTINSPEFTGAVNLMTMFAEVAPVIIIRGNHDPSGSLNIFSKIKTKHPIHVYENFTPDSITVKNKTIYFLAIPYIAPNLLSSGSGGTDALHTVKDSYAAGTSHLKKMVGKYVKDKKVVDADGLNFIIAHVLIGDSVLANSEKILENEVRLDVEDLDYPDIDGVFLGHIHQGEQEIFKGKRIRYSGAHYRTNFAETNTPGFYMWTFKDKEPVIRFIETPARMMYEFSLDEEESIAYVKSGNIPFEIPPDSDVKVIMNVPEGLMRMLKKKSIACPESSDLTLSVRVKPKQAVRSESIIKLKTEVEKVVEWGKISGIEITPAIKKKVVGITDEADL